MNKLVCLLPDQLILSPLSESDEGNTLNNKCPILKRTEVCVLRLTWLPLKRWQVFPPFVLRISYRETLIFIKYNLYYLMFNSNFISTINNIMSTSKVLTCSLTGWLQQSVVKLIEMYLYNNNIYLAK